ncbi:dihydrofolate reductase [Thermocatellispora tengchongensis]|uniref:Dihydrofolate reductase n=1 Tax=Thermocatellispora tengchongensis TaxID=1073253 RepID=A0A840PNI1_9ACTN|nr:dihydrofolate reductase [Thermocatellispora tengchongensis]
MVESPEKWQTPYFNHEVGAELARRRAGVGAMLLGRNTYERFAAFWPHQTQADNPMADAMNKTPKLVASTTLEKAEWENSTLIQGDAVAELAKLKHGEGPDILSTGSPTLVRSLLRAGLVDELGLLVNPIVVGSGRRLFDGGFGELPLRLLDCRTFGTGVVALTYTAG